MAIPSEEPLHKVGTEDKLILTALRGSVMSTVDWDWQLLESVMVTVNNPVLKLLAVLVV
jgi:hypothetical protein